MSDGASRQAIEHHYDVGRDFYELWLDARLVYSCAYWPGEPDDDLEAAQTAKLAWHADAAGVGASSRVLDVGCGWGALLAYLTDERGVARATGLTLSSDQAAASRARAPDADVVLEGWADHRADAAYDAIISIGAFEHFARADLDTDHRRVVYRSFFDRCAGWLPAGGRLSLQTIAHEDWDPATTPPSAFFTDEIFPESGLPRLSDIVVSAEARFRILAVRSDPDHYSATLRLWQQRLEADRDRAVDLVGRDTYRRYLRYLRVSRALFDRRVCTLHRLVLERRPDGPVPIRTLGTPPR